MVATFAHNRVYMLDLESPPKINNISQYLFVILIVLLLLEIYPKKFELKLTNNEECFDKINHTIEITNKEKLVQETLHFDRLNNKEKEKLGNSIVNIRIFFI